MTILHMQLLLLQSRKQREIQCLLPLRIKVQQNIWTIFSKSEKTDEDLSVKNDELFS